MQDLINQIPEEYRDLFQQIVALTDAFCQRHLNPDYCELCRDMAFTLCVEDSPFTGGRVASWASGIVHALGWVNFLQDPTFPPYMSTSQVAAGFGVSQGTMVAKSRIIRDELDLIQLDPDWCLPELLEHNPLVWMVEVNGFIMDIRTAPLEVQQAAYEKGLIPFIPEPEDEAEPPAGEGPTILKFPGTANDNTGPRRPKRPVEDGPSLWDQPWD